MLTLRGLVLAAVVTGATLAHAGTAPERIAADKAAGRPLVAHAFVALCDNRYQGIVPVPKHLGNGQDPKGNLYWGARFGIRSYFPRTSAWRPVPAGGAPPAGVLERLVFVTESEGARVFLMDFGAPDLPAGRQEPARAAIVLACASRPYFLSLLQRANAHPLLLTTGLMAPEAYSLEAALRTWFDTRDTDETRRAAAAAYDTHQRCGPRAARRLFAVGGRP